MGAVYHINPSPPIAVKKHAYHNFTALRRQARRDGTLSHQARHLYEDICELAERDGYCSAGDAHFAEAYGASRRTVRRWVAELREAGYIRTEGATRSRRITPSDPADLGHDLGQQGVPSGPDLGHDLGHPGAPDLGHPGADTKRVNTPPEGESGARTRTREGQDTPADADLSSAEPTSLQIPEAERPDYAPALDQVLLQAKIAGVPPDVAERFFWHYEANSWLTSSENPRPVGHWPALLMRWRIEEQARSARATPAHRAARAVALPDLSEAFPREHLPVVLAAQPTLDEDDFHAAGTDWRGKPLIKLSLAARQALGITP